ncbi:hypothetical protein BV25DRAFT_1837711 [Artomyces pyxidatus]|uniref:Uncharacterized protein n=1 Tax=Artomyces pyxidatus TaxID=48021 RepID=A0ACB8T3P8_9AGAM|nr:hypothetical protein BV25DRAFT_1837711 [Artomyces pyxidatus]
MAQALDWETYHLNGVKRGTGNSWNKVEMPIGASESNDQPDSAAITSMSAHGITRPFLQRSRHRQALEKKEIVGFHDPQTPIGATGIPDDPALELEPQTLLRLSCLLQAEKLTFGGEKPDFLLRWQIAPVEQAPRLHELRSWEMGFPSRDPGSISRYQLGNCIHRISYTHPLNGSRVFTSGSRKSSRVGIHGDHDRSVGKGGQRPAVATKTTHKAGRILQQEQKVKEVEGAQFPSTLEPSKSKRERTFSNGAHVDWIFRGQQGRERVERSQNQCNIAKVVESSKGGSIKI